MMRIFVQSAVLLLLVMGLTLVVQASQTESGSAAENDSFISISS